MENNSPKEEGTNRTVQPTVHLVLQGKGGIGKSVVASWLAEFLISRGQPVRCIDGDPVNRSLGQYKALAAEKLDLVNQEGLLQRARYDALMERFMTEDAVFLVDSGATAFTKSSALPSTPSEISVVFKSIVHASRPNRAETVSASARSKSARESMCCAVCCAM